MGEISTVGVLRLRATSAVSRDKSVRRSAQDDDFVASWRARNSVFSDFYCLPNKLALMGRAPSFSAHVRSHGKPGQVGEGHPSCSCRSVLALFGSDATQTPVQHRLETCG